MVQTSVVLSKVDCQTNGSRHRTTTHRARNVSHNDCVHGLGQVVRQSLPLSFNNGIQLIVDDAVTIATAAVASTHILFDQVVRIQSSSINLDLTLRYALQVSIKTLMVMLSKCRTVVVHCIRRNLSVINQTPLTGGHLTLNNIDVLTQRGQHLTILTRLQVQGAHSLSSHLASLHRGSIFRRHPLCQQRNRHNLLRSGSIICLHISCQSLSDILPHQLFALGTAQNEPRVETVEVRNQLNVLVYNFGMVFCQPTQADTEGTTLTQTTLANITGVEQHLGCQQLILTECSGKLLLDFTVSARTQCANLREQV